MNITWLDLNCSYAHSSLALPAIHAQPHDETHTNWDKVSATINEDIASTVSKVARQSPDIIAATCWLFTHESLINILSRCKALMPGVKIILGGPEFLGANEQFLRTNSFVDCVLRGEGEEAFYKWLDVWQATDKWDDVEGLCYINKDGIYKDNGTVKVKAFDHLRYPEESRFFNWDKPFVQLETTRGCFNSCAFCTSGNDRPVRSIALPEIDKRIANIAAHGIKDIRMLDRTFNYDPQRAEAMLDIFSRYAGQMHFHLEVHPGLLTERLKDKIAALPAGLLHIEAGIQSLNEDVIAASKRRGNAGKSISGLRQLCSMSNTVTHADLIAGLPRYTLDMIFADVATLAAYDAGEIQLESLKVLPGTEMRAMAREAGIIYSPLPPYEVLATPDISMDEMSTATALSQMLDGYYNTAAWQRPTRRLITTHTDFLRRFLAHLDTAGITGQPTSLERRGIVLYQFCKANYPSEANCVSMAWIEAGMSLKKEPAERVITRHTAPDATWRPVSGHYEEGMRLCFLPDEDMQHGYWYGYPTDRQSPYPTFKAYGRLSVKI